MSVGTLFTLEIDIRFIYRSRFAHQFWSIRSASNFDTLICCHPESRGRERGEYCEEKRQTALFGRRSSFELYRKKCCKSEEFGRSHASVWWSWTPSTASQFESPDGELENLEARCSKAKHVGWLKRLESAESSFRSDTLAVLAGFSKKSRKMLEKYFDRWRFGC